MDIILVVMWERAALKRDRYGCAGFFVQTIMVVVFLVVVAIALSSSTLLFDMQNQIPYRLCNLEFGRTPVYHNSLDIVDGDKS